MTSISLFLGMVWGLLLGSMYFGGLWLTVKNVARVNKPHLLLLTSFLVRCSMAALGFWFILQHDVAQCLTALLFFLLPRLMIAGFIRHTGRGGKYADQP